VLEFTSFWNASHPTLTLVDNNDGEEQCGALERIEEHTSELKPRSGKVRQSYRMAILNSQQRLADDPSENDREGNHEESDSAVMSASQHL
jgi:hypothetical protein